MVPGPYMAYLDRGRPQDWEERLKAELGGGHPSEQDEDEDWDLQDDIQVAE